MWDASYGAAGGRTIVSMATEDVAGRIMWRAVRIVRLPMRTRRIPAT